MKAKLTRQVLVRREAVYSSDGDLRIWQTPVLKKCPNSSVQARVFIRKERKEEQRNQGKGLWT